MTIWDPWGEFSRMEREIGRMFDELWGGPRKGGRRPALTGKAGQVPAERERMLIGTPCVDLIDKKNSLVLKSEIPGVKKKDIKIIVTDDEVSISGQVAQTKEEKKEDYYHCERVYSSWQRTVPLPVKVQCDKAKAAHKDGVLEITLPKSEEAREKRREIKID